MRASQCVESRPRRTVAFFDYATVKNALRSSEELHRLSVALRNHVLSVSNPVQNMCELPMYHSSLKVVPQVFLLEPALSRSQTPSARRSRFASHESEVGHSVLEAMMLSFVSV